MEVGALDFDTTLAVARDLAPALEALGYDRYWITEHAPQANPQILVALAAGLTERIRVGTAGVLLALREPCDLAQNFFLLERLFPGRIDAGFCGKGGASPALTRALRRGAPGEEGTVEQTATLVNLLRHALPEGHPLAVVTPRTEDEAPQIWSMGSGPSSARLSGELGIAYAYSLFHSFSRDDAEAVNLYRASFRPSRAQREPLVALAIAGICTDEGGRSRELATAVDNASIVLHHAGTKASWQEKIEDLVARYRMDVLVFRDLCRDPTDKLRSHDLLLQAAAPWRTEPTITP